MTEEHPEIEIPAIFWEVYPVAVTDPDDGVLIRLEWGWTAGMTPEELTLRAEDAPQGKDSVTLLLDQAVSLRDRLTKLIEGQVPG